MNDLTAAAPNGAVAASWVPNQADVAALTTRPGIVSWVKVRSGPMCVARCDAWKAILSLDEADGRTWYHVSVSGGRVGSGKPELPTWAQLQSARDALFRHDAVVVQILPPRSEWYSIGDVLHLWQRLGADRLVPDMRRGGEL